MVLDMIFILIQKTARNSLSPDTLKLKRSLPSTLKNFWAFYEVPDSLALVLKRPIRSPGTGV